MNKRILLSIFVIAVLATGIGYAILQQQSATNEIAESEDDDDFRYDSEEQRDLAEAEDPSDANEEFEGTDSGGGVIDQPYEGNESAEGVSSDSGKITLQSPTPGSTVGNGDTLRGVAEVGTIQYRIVDHERGVIGQGEINVTNGTFSGTIQIRPTGSRGTIELFTFDPVTSAEQNRVKIEVGLSN